MKVEQQAKWLAIAVIAALYPIYLYFNGWIQLERHSMDLPSFYQAAQVTFVEHRSPYGPATLDEIDCRHTYPYLYPPASLLCFYPFALVSYPAAKAGFLLLNHLLLVAILLLLFGKILRADLGRHILLAPLLTLYFFFYLPFAQTLGHGQVNLLVLFCMLWIWHLLRSGGPEWQIAPPLVLAILLKTYPALFLLLFLIKRRWRVLLFTGVGLAAVHLAAWFILPMPVWGEWFRLVMPTGGYFQEPLGLFWPTSSGNQSLNGVLMRLFSNSDYSRAVWYDLALGRTLTYLLAGGLILATALFSWRLSRAREEGRIDAEVHLFTLCMVLVAPLSWIHHLVFVYPALMAAALTSGYQRKQLAVLACIAVAMVSQNFYRRPEVLSGGWLLLISLPALAMIVLYVYFFAEGRRAVNTAAADHLRPTPSSRAAAAPTIARAVAQSLTPRADPAATPPADRAAAPGRVPKATA